MPPEAASVMEYAPPTYPESKGEAVMIESDAETEAIVSDNVVEAVAPALSVTWAVMLKEPDAVGVPDIKPVLESVKPAGSAPDADVNAQAYGGLPPVAASVWE